MTLSLIIFNCPLRLSAQWQQQMLSDDTASVKQAAALAAV
jgi:hypothetical protein